MTASTPHKLTPLKIAGQVIATSALLGFVGYFASGPTYPYFRADEALVKLSITHASQRREACHQRTKEELAALPPNMRAAMKCSRERVPMRIEIDVDGVTRLAVEAQPAGLSKDLAASVYKLFRVPAGPHTIAVRMRDSGRETGFDHAVEQQMQIKPQDVLVVDFDADRQQFRFR